MLRFAKWHRDNALAVQTGWRASHSSRAPAMPVWSLPAPNQASIPEHEWRVAQKTKPSRFGSTTIKIRGALTDQTSLHEPALTRASAQPQKWVAELSSTSRSSGTCRLTSSSEVRYWTLCRLLCCSTRCGAQPRASTGTHRRLIFCPSGFRTE